VAVDQPAAVSTRPFDLLDRRHHATRSVAGASNDYRLFIYGTDCAAAPKPGLFVRPNGTTQSWSAVERLGACRSRRIAAAAADEAALRYANWVSRYLTFTHDST